MKIFLKNLINLVFQSSFVFYIYRESIALLLGSSLILLHNIVVLSQIVFQIT